MVQKKGMEDKKGRVPGREREEEEKVKPSSTSKTSSSNSISGSMKKPDTSSSKKSR